jgi:3-phenylpropionate/trans-cinnamate dioxygenase ferredoxin subunit
MVIAKTWTPVAKTAELTNGTMKSVKVGEREILLAMVNNKYYAANNLCPHMGGNLSRGKLEGTVVTCPRHHSKFDLIDGKVIRWTDWTGIKASVNKLFRPPTRLAVFPVKVEGDSIFIEI